VLNLTPLGAGLLGTAFALLFLGCWLVYLGAARLGRRPHRPTGSAGSPTLAAELARSI
jgi:hypothetical protein